MNLIYLVVKLLLPDYIYGSVNVSVGFQVNKRANTFVLPQGHALFKETFFLPDFILSNCKQTTLIIVYDCPVNHSWVSRVTTRFRALGSFQEYTGVCDCLKKLQENGEDQKVQSKNRLEALFQSQTGCLFYF